MQGRLRSNTIPAGFLEWLVSSRKRFLNDLKEGKPLKYFSAHLPVMATWNPASLSGSPPFGSSGMGEFWFPVNMTVKGIGLLPNKELLEYYTDVFEGVLAVARTMPWNESMPERVAAIGGLYSNIENFDPALLGGLEIFEGKAFENLKGNPYASLLYMGMDDRDGTAQYMSFQVNGSVEILDRNDPYYRFLLASRKLFEFERFHIYQSDYPFGYLIRVMEVRDKSPWSRNLKT